MVSELGTSRHSKALQKRQAKRAAALISDCFSKVDNELYFFCFLRRSVPCSQCAGTVAFAYVDHTLGQWDNGIYNGEGKVAMVQLAVDIPIVPTFGMTDGFVCYYDL